MHYWSIGERMLPLIPMYYYYDTFRTSENQAFEKSFACALIPRGGNTTYFALEHHWTL